MYDFTVDRDTDGSRKWNRYSGNPVSLERRCRIRLAYDFLGKSVNFGGRHPRADYSPDLVQDIGDDSACLSHEPEIPFPFETYHDLFAHMVSMACITTLLDVAASTERRRVFSL